MKKYFITGTDTDVGKTLVSSVLTLALQGNYWKPIQAGVSNALTDFDYVQQLTGLSNEHFFSANYSLQAALCPDQAAELENITIDLDHCKMPHSPRTLLVEGAGGVWVPLNENQCVLDLMKQLNIPVVIVARGTLGTINHTLLTIAAVRQAGLDIHGIIFSGELNPANQVAIEKWGNVKTLFHVPHFNEVNPASIKTWVDSNRDSIKECFA
jgi:dethiobiotin synthetase